MTGIETPVKLLGFWVLSKLKRYFKTLNLKYLYFLCL